MTYNLILLVAISVFILLVIGIAVTVYEFTYDEGSPPKKKAKKQNK